MRHGTKSPILAVTLAIAGCGGGDDDTGGDASMSATLSTTVTTTAGNDSTGAPESSSDADEASSEVGSEGTTSMTGSAATTTPADSGESTGGAEGRCMPSNAPFGQVPPALPQASIAFDFGAQTCSVMGLMSTPPQIVIDVQDTGLLDATAYGIEITDTHPEGLQFDNPPVGDSQVIDFGPDVYMTFTGTTIPDGVPIVIEFIVDPAGPALREVSATFG